MVAAQGPGHALEMLSLRCTHGGKGTSPSRPLLVANLPNF